MSLKCNLCQGWWKMPRGWHLKTVCPTCSRATNAMRAAHSKHPANAPKVDGQDERVAALALRAGAGLALFPGRRT